MASSPRDARRPRHAPPHPATSAFVSSCPPLLSSSRTAASHLAYPLSTTRRRAPRHFIASRSRRAVRVAATYSPLDDDRAETTPEQPNELTLAQELLLNQYVDQIRSMSDQECRDLAVEIVRQMLVKDNIMKKMFGRDINFGVEPPDPDDLQPPDDN